MRLNEGAVVNDPLRTTKTSVAGDRVQQTWSALWWLDRLITEHGIGRMVELGTGTGALASFIGLRCRVETLDKEDRRKTNTLRNHGALSVYFHHVSIFSDGGFELLDSLAKIDTRTLWLFDNGDKPREFETFAGRLPRPRDLVLVHDSGDKEIHPWAEFEPDAPSSLEVARAASLRRIYKVELEESETRLSAWVKEDIACSRQ